MPLYYKNRTSCILQFYWWTSGPTCFNSVDFKHISCTYYKSVAALYKLYLSIFANYSEIQLLPVKILEKYSVLDSVLDLLTFLGCALTK